MPGPEALKIELTDAEREHLEKTVRKQTATQRQVRRSKIVLMAGEGLPNGEIARQRSPGPRFPVLPMDDPDFAQSGHESCVVKTIAAETVRRWLKIADLKLRFLLDNYATRKTAPVKQFIAEQNGWVQLHLTPTHVSWLNQIELWFATLTRRVLSLGNFAGLDELAENVRRFIKYYNNNEAPPYHWTYTGQPRAV